MSICKGGPWILAIICLVLVFPVSVIAKEEQFTLKLATLAPEGSTWMKAFNEANRL